MRAAVPFSDTCVVSLDHCFSCRPISLNLVDGFFKEAIPTFHYTVDKEEFEQYVSGVKTIFLSVFHLNFDVINEFVARYPDKRIILGGYFVNKNPLEAAKRFDGEFIGLGDIVQILDDFLQHGFEVSGINSKEAMLSTGTYTVSAYKPLHLFPTSQKSQYCIDSDEKYIFILGSRNSCPAECVFCGRYSNLPHTGLPTSTRDLKTAEQIFDEIKAIEAHEFPPDIQIRIIDSDFFGWREQRLRAAKLAAIFEDHTFRHPLGIWTSPQALWNISSNIMERINVRSCMVGFENFSDSFLERNTKGYKSLDTNLKALLRVKEKNWSCSPLMIFFEPFMTLDEFLENLQVFLEYDLLYMFRDMFSKRMILYNGTEVFHRYVDWANMSGIHVDYGKDYRHVSQWCFVDDEMEKAWIFLSRIYSVIQKNGLLFKGMVANHGPHDKTVCSKGVLEAGQVCLHCPHRMYSPNEFIRKVINSIFDALINFRRLGASQEFADEYIESLHTLMKYEIAKIILGHGIQLDIEDLDHNLFKKEGLAVRPTRVIGYDNRILEFDFNSTFDLQLDVTISQKKDMVIQSTF